MKFSASHPVCRTLLAREVSTVKYLPGWLAGPLRACFSQTFGIITFCGTLAALMMLSASAVADSHPWRRRMRYILGVVVFATAIAATPAHTHILPKLQHHPTRYEVWNISTFVPAVIDVIRHCSGNPVSQVARASATECAIIRYPSRYPEAHAHLDPGSSRSGTSIAGRVHLPSTCSQARIVMRHPAAAIYARLMRAPRTQALFNITRLRPSSLPPRPAVLISRQQPTELFRSLR